MVKFYLQSIGTIMNSQSILDQTDCVDMGQTTHELKIIKIANQRNSHVK